MSINTLKTHTLKLMFKNKKIKIKAIIFDLGGVFVKDTDPLILEDLSQILKMNKNKIKNAIQKFITLLVEGKITSIEFSIKLCNELKLNKKYHEKLKNLFRDLYIKHVFLDKKMISLVKALRKKFPIYALTNTIAMHENYNRKQGLFDNFDKVFCSNRIHMAKPYCMDGEMKISTKQTKIYRYVCLKINKNPKNCIFVDDKLPNLRPASKIGMYTIHFKNYNQLLFDLKKLELKI